MSRDFSVRQEKMLEVVAVGYVDKQTLGALAP